MDLRLDSKTAVVVGSGGHLMSAIAKEIALSGAFVYCADFSKESAERTASEIRSLGGNSSSLVIDVTSTESILAAYQETETDGRSIDYLVNGAGINAPTPFLEIRRDEWDRILNVQLVGVAECCRIFGRGMLDRGYGSIVNVSSASANPPLSKAFVYSAAKSAVLNFSKNLAREWATKGVRVNILRPGFFPTEWNRKNFIDAKREEDILRHTPMGRFGEPSELSAAVIWLLSDRASFVTGSEIAIDGGFSAMTI